MNDNDDTLDAARSLDCLCGARVEFKAGQWVTDCAGCGLELRRVDFADVCGDNDGEDGDYVEGNGLDPDAMMEADTPMGLDDDGGWCGDC